MARKRNATKSRTSPDLLAMDEESMDQFHEAKPGWVQAVQQSLLKWYSHHRRELPWREDHDPYRILVSEMMLIQTTVTAVIPYYERFLAKFPTVQVLAAAEPADVLKAWEGLGYYRRARLLHAAAQAVVERYHGVFPSEPRELVALPGIGRYIAGAVASFAFDRPAPIVEANTQRLLARIIAWPGELAQSRSQKRLWALAEALVPEQNAGDFNQALMDVGATLCQPRNPMCLVCPLNSLCEVRRAGLQESIPVSACRPAPLLSREIGLLAVRGSQILLAKRRSGQLWEDFWEIPTVHQAGANPAGRVSLEPTRDINAAFLEATGLEIETGTDKKEFKYSVTRHSVTLAVLESRKIAGRQRPGPGYAELRWVDWDEVKALSLSAVNRRVMVWGRRANCDKPPAETE